MLAAVVCGAIIRFRCGDTGRVGRDAFRLYSTADTGKLAEPGTKELMDGLLTTVTRVWAIGAR